MKIRALNEPEVSNSTSGESSNDEAKQPNHLSKDALEEQCFEKYRRALIAIQEQKRDDAKELLEELNDELIESSSDDGTLVQLRFSVLKNLGNLANDDVDHFIDALAIDPTDISLWIKAGDRCAKIVNFPLARRCYEQALEINPKNWVAVDRLIEVYYIIHLPFELYDICTTALSLNPHYKKATIFSQEAIRLQPSLAEHHETQPEIHRACDTHHLIENLERVKRKRRDRIDVELRKFKKPRLSITLDTSRTQSLSSLGNYIIKIYERFAKQGLTRNSLVDLTLNNSLSFTQHVNGSTNSQSNNQNSSEPQTTSSQDVDMVIEVDGASISDNDKSNNRNDNNVSLDDADQNKSNSRNRLNQTFQKSSSLSFAAMLFPMDLGDKRRSSRNRNNQDDTFSFKMKFDELNELLPECLRIGAIEQVLQQRREEQLRNSQENEKDSQDEPVLVETNLEPVREDLIIKDIVETISGTLHSNGNKDDIKLCDMLRIYLCKLAAKKQNSLPEAFIKIYKIYRRLCPLPSGAFIELNHKSGLSLDELWFTLTANEIAYQKQECLFLLRILEQLNLYLDETQHKEFLVRLFLILGVNHDHEYLESALQNIEEETRLYASNRKIITRAYIKTLIDRTNEKLQQENEDADNSIDLINKLAPKSETEMSDREIMSLCSAIRSAQVWQRGMDILNQRNDLNLDIIMDTINTCLKNGARMDAILSSKLCKEAISGSRPTTWTCLIRGWRSVLDENEYTSATNLIKVDKFFELGHQTIGKKGTCTVDKGEFLMLHIQHMLEDAETFEERELLGSLNCLFSYPSKKPASVSTHKAQRVPISWDYSEVIYDYLVPEELPTYMSLLRKVGITSELEALFIEIVSVIPDKYKPNAGAIENYIQYGLPIPDSEVESHNVTKDIYYFLADYYFKNKDFSKALNYYHHDLALNRTRFDSWAASGLIRANAIDRALSDGDVTIDDYVKGAFCKLSDAAMRCFEKATQLKPNEAKATLWIEYGNLTYNMTSLGKRLFIYHDLEVELDARKVSEDIAKLESRYNHLYSVAEKCFKSANELCQSSEVWLHYYMLGKIYEKIDPFKALIYYNKADAQLFHEGASYPRKISYHNPPDLAYESMEVHYRIHSTVLKYLLDCQDITQEEMNRLKGYLINAQRSSFVELEGALNPKSQMNSDVDKDVRLLICDLEESISKNADFDELVFMCLHGMKRCLVRCDKNFKALYRLAHYYRTIQDSAMAQEILMTREMKTDRRIRTLLARKPGVPEFRAAPPDLHGIDSLFKDRKQGNLFFNIWRIPVEEVDRPGSFEHWMFKCTRLLIQASIDLGDSDTLTSIAFQLSRQPETSKKYLQDKPRILLAKFATSSIVKLFDKTISQADSEDDRRYYIKQGQALAERLIKANVFADQMRQFGIDLQTRLTVKSHELIQLDSS